MRRCRFVEPKTTRLALSDDDWIEVKRDLTYGEQSEMFAGMRTRPAPGQPLELDPLKVGPARLLAYLVGWSFRDAQDRPAAISAGALSQLEAATVRELTEALDAHEAAREREREAEKKTPAMSIASDPTSPSVA